MIRSMVVRAFGIATVVPLRFARIRTRRRWRGTDVAAVFLRIGTRPEGTGAVGTLRNVQSPGCDCTHRHLSDPACRACYAGIGLDEGEVSRTFCEEPRDQGGLDVQPASRPRAPALQPPDGGEDLPAPQRDGHSERLPVLRRRLRAA